MTPLPHRRRRGPFRPSLLGPALLAGALVALLVAERRRPLRREREGVAEHEGRNLVIAALSAATLQALERPVVEPLARAVERHRLGLVPALGLPPSLETAASVVLLDYTLYLWHVLTHRSGVLWRFHAVHHADRDMTASTALRFHFGEMALSVPWRAGQVLLIGASPRALRLWQRLTLASIVFQHSNLALPRALDDALALVVVTPRMHGIHHSDQREESDSNWSSGLTIWDRLHGTLRLGVPQEGIVTGVEGLGRPDDVTLARMLAWPFRKADADP